MSPSDRARSTSLRRHSLVDLATGQVRPAIAEAPLLSSHGGPWSDLLLEHHPPGYCLESNDVAATEHVVIAKIRGPSVLEWRDNGRFRPVCFLPGQVMVIPAHCPFSCRTARSGEIVAVSVRPPFLRFAAHGLVAGPDLIELRPTLPIEDSLAFALVDDLRHEAEAGYPGGSAYGESLAHALVARMICRYSNRTVADQGTVCRGLGRGELRRAIDFLEAHLAEDIPLSAVAAACDLSPHHFARAFKRSTGLSPHQYLIRCRVERARALLLASRMPSAQVAVEVGFCDQSHLTSHFRRAYGVTPNEFRRRMLPA